MALEAVVRDLQDAAVVMSHLEKRLAETAKEQAIRLVALEEHHLAFQERFAGLEISNAEAQEKLNALIQIVDSWIRAGGRQQ